MIDLLINKDRLQTIIDDFPLSAFLIDLSNRYLMVNQKLENLFEITGDELLGRSPYDIYSRKLVARLFVQNAKVIETNKPLTCEERISLLKGKTMKLLTTKSPIINDQGKAYSIVGITTDITDREMSKKDRERLVIELRDAISIAMNLDKIITICCSCNKIRNDKGNWEQIDLNISIHSEIKFSHGICHECGINLYPDYFKEIEED